MKKQHEITIDGETYWLTTADAFSQLALDEVGAKLLGHLFRVLVKSRGVVDSVGALLMEMSPLLQNREEFDAAMQMGIVEFVRSNFLETETGRDVIEQGLHLLAEAAELLSQTLTREDMMTVIENALLKCLEAQWQGQRVKIGDKLTYRQMMDERIEKHSSHHQRKLMWEAVKLNLGPTIAGDLIGLLRPSAPASS